MIGRALRAQARSAAGDIVLLWAAVAAFGMSLSLVTIIPPEFADAPAELRAALAAPFGAVLATYGSILAAAYGSFRYTVDRRDGVVAQRLMLQRRWPTLLARMPASAVGGAIVAAAALGGGHLALAVSGVGASVDGGAVASALALGAAAALWGLGLGVVVQVHLLALFLAPMSLGGALLVAMLWPDGAVYLPLVALLEALRFDVTAVGIGRGNALDASLAAVVGASWVAVMLLASSLVFMRRDVR